MGECYLEDDIVVCEIEDKKLKGVGPVWSVLFDGLKVGWHSPSSPPGLLVQFRDPHYQDMGCYLAEDEGIIYCFPKSKLEAWLGDILP